MRIVKGIFLLLLTILLISLALHNRQFITVNLFPLPLAVDMPLFLFLFTLVVIGIMLGWCMSLPARLRLRTALRRERQKAKNLEEKLRINETEQHITKTYHEAYPALSDT